jgi:phage terminase large subunit-like protein
MPQSPDSTSYAPPALHAAPPGLKGKTTPRLYTPPLRPLNRRTSDGYDVCDFAEITGQPLLPWQRWAAIHALEVNPDGSYRFRIILIVVARQNGKSDLKRTISLWRMFMQPRCRVLGVAQEVGLAREQWNLAQETIRDAPELAAEFDRSRNVNGDEMFWLKNGSRYAIKAASRKSGRGGSNDEVNFDELREQRDWRAWAAVSKTTMARPNSQIWLMSNAGDDESVVLNQLRDAALSRRDPTIGLFEWSADYDDDRYCDIDDWKQIAQANPGLGHIIAASAIASAMTSDPAGVFRTEVLCQRVRHVDAAIDMNAWNDCADPAVTMDTLRNRLAVCLDVAPDGDHATLAAAARTLDGKVRGEIIAHWPDAGQARRELPELLRRIRPCVIGWYPSGPAAELAPVFRAPDGRMVTLDHARPGTPAYENLTGNTVLEACMGLAGLVKARQVLHNNDPLLTSHAGNATRLNVGDGWRFARRDTENGHVDAIYAFAGAVQLALTMPEPRRAKVRLLSA